jgi:hypothetical protein
VALKKQKNAMATAVRKREKQCAPFSRARSALDESARRPIGDFSEKRPLSTAQNLFVVLEGEMKDGAM